MKPRLNDQLFARCSAADRKKVDRAARLSHVKVADIIRLGTLDYAAKVIQFQEDAKKEGVA